MLVPHSTCHWAGRTARPWAQPVQNVLKAQDYKNNLHTHIGKHDAECVALETREVLLF